MSKDLQWVLEAYLQANTNNAVRNLGSRGVILDDAMAELADKLKIGWHRSPDGQWHFGKKNTPPTAGE